MARNWAHACALLGLAALIATPGALGQSLSQQLAAAGGSGSSGAVGATSSVAITEVLVDNQAALKDESGSTPAWGYTLTSNRSGGPPAWPFPAGTILGPGQYLLVLADGRGSNDSSAPASSVAVNGATAIHASFKLGREDGYVGLRSPDGSVVAELAFPWPAPEVSFGLASSRGLVTAAAGPPTSSYALLASPTPGRPNSGPRASGPLLLGTLRNPTPRPDGSADIVVTTSVLAQQNPVTSVQLLYVVGYGAETAVDMAPAANASAPGAPPPPGGAPYAGAIPAAAAPPGALVRWAVVATDSTGATTRDPPGASTSARKYYGTVVADSSDAADLPVLDLYCKDAKAPFSDAGVKGCAMWLGGAFYDNLEVSRRGVTSKGWPKPKFKISAKKQGDVLRLRQDLPLVTEFNMNRRGRGGEAEEGRGVGSEWAEPGENTFMREPLVWQAFGEMGVEALVASHLHVRLNGAYYGKFALVEAPAASTLQRWGYSMKAPGPLFKSTSGEYSNLRWDIPVDQARLLQRPTAPAPAGRPRGAGPLRAGEACPRAAGADARGRTTAPRSVRCLPAPSQVKYYWKVSLVKGSNASAEAELVALARGLAGGGGERRTAFLFDALNLPQVINHMAAQTLILNQDRCTKNFFVYRDPANGNQWSMIPWDVESGFASDRGLGGKPAPDYCIESCDQWTSPLYCDHNHPQMGRMHAAGMGRRARDLTVRTPWGLINAGRRLASSFAAGAASYAAGTAEPDPALRALAARSARKLLQDAAADVAPSPLPPADVSSAPSATAPPVPQTEGGTGVGEPAAEPRVAAAAGPPSGSLPANASIEGNYDADQTQLGVAQPPPPPPPPPQQQQNSSGLVTGVRLAPEYSNPDVNLQLIGPTKTGAAGTYNYLIDAVLAVPATRAMYLRRLRMLMDQFSATGRLEALATQMYQQIRSEAKRDAAKWGNSGDPDRGYQQLVTEQLPLRKQQLYSFYGPGGAIPLIPDAQPSSVPLQLGAVEPGASGGYVEIINPSPDAVDVSGFSLSGAVSFTFRPGTVIPPQASLYAAASVQGFLQRGASPRGGEGRLVVGPLGGSLLGRAAAVSLSDASGNNLF
eukprot:scaffold4.g4584.t1